MRTSNTLPKPRGYLVTALLLSTVMALPMGLFFTWVSAMRQHQSFREALRLGMLGGAIAGVAYGATTGTRLRGERRVVSVPDPKSFGSRVNTVATQLGYRLALVTESHVSFCPSWKTGLLAGPLSVQLRESDAVIVGPRWHVEQLLLRLEGQVTLFGSLKSAVASAQAALVALRMRSVRVTGEEHPTVSGRTRRSWTAPGERVRVRLVPDGSDRVLASVSSVPTQWTIVDDYGKSRDTVRAVCAALVHSGSPE